MTTTDVTGSKGLDHNKAMALQAAELSRTLDLLETLSAADWSAQTECPAWDVHHMYLHVLGACEAATSIRELVHQMRAGRAHQKANGGPLEAGLSAVQVRDREHLGPAELVERLRTVAPLTVKKRTSLPGFLRSEFGMKVDGPVVERWKLGYLVDTIYLRDLWLHRVDASRATGKDLVLTVGHDDRIIADVAAEWAHRHDQPVVLELTGPVGGTFVHKEGGEHLVLDAVEFCRTVGGRTDGTGLLTTVVPF